MKLVHAVSLFFVGASLQTSAFAWSCQGRVSGGQTVLAESSATPFSSDLQINFFETRTGVPTQPSIKFKSSSSKKVSNFSVTTAKNTTASIVVSVASNNKGVLQIDVKQGPRNAAQHARYNVTCKPFAVPAVGSPFSDGDSTPVFPNVGSPFSDGDSTPVFPNVGSPFSDGDSTPVFPNVGSPFSDGDSSPVFPNVGSPFSDEGLDSPQSPELPQFSDEGLDSPQSPELPQFPDESLDSPQSPELPQFPDESLDSPQSPELPLFPK